MTQFPYQFQLKKGPPFSHDLGRGQEIAEAKQMHLYEFWNSGKNFIPFLTSKPFSICAWVCEFIDYHNSVDWSLFFIAYFGWSLHSLINNARLYGASSSSSSPISHFIVSSYQAMLFKVEMEQSGLLCLFSSRLLLPSTSMWLPLLQFVQTQTHHTEILVPSISVIKGRESNKAVT